MYDFKTKLEPFARGFLNCESELNVKKTASGFLQSAKDSPLRIDPKTGLCNASMECHVNFSFGSGVTMSERRINRLIENNPDDKEDLEYIKKNIQPYLVSNCFDGVFNEKQELVQEEGHVWGGGWMGHSVPDHAKILKFGTEWFRNRIAKYREINKGKDDFYDALEMILDSLVIIGQRLHKLADEMLATATDPLEIENLEIVKKTFDHAPKKPCDNFAEAAIVFILLFDYDGVDSPGWFDQYMFEFWDRTEPALRRRYLEAVWQFFYETRTWNLCISGSDENWNDLTNDLTYEILDLVKKHKYETPNLTMRCHRNTPEKLMHAAYEAIASGTGLPALYNDEAVCPAIEKLGIPAYDSHMYVMNGCNQIDIQGKSHMGLEDGEVAFSKVVELTLYNGVSDITGAEVGIKTGDARDFKTFDEFYAAFIKQLDYATDMAVELSNIHQELYSRVAQNPFRSLLTEGCIEKGREFKNGGPLYGEGQILAEGIADAADSLAAIKKYVYEDKMFTMDELITALKNDFEGYEDMHHFLKNSDLKFGNDIDYVDRIAADIVDHFNKYLTTKTTFRGGHFSGGCSPFVRAPDYGSVTAALPNGKKKGEPMLADSIGATPGCDKNGPTALLNSCLKYDHSIPGSGFVLNVKFDRDLFCTADGEKSFLALAKSYLDRKGQMLAVSVVSQADLIDAQNHPEKYGHVIVRVGGYSGRFVELSKELQDNVIARTSLKV